MPAQYSISAKSAEPDEMLNQAVKSVLMPGFLKSLHVSLETLRVLTLGPQFGL